MALTSISCNFQKDVLVLIKKLRFHFEFQLLTIVLPKLHFLTEYNSYLQAQKSNLTRKS